MSKDTKITAIDKTEFEVAEHHAEISTNTYTHKFNKPFIFEEKTYDELTFDWGKLTGSDSLAIENEIQALGKALITPEFSGEYLTRMAVRACTEPIGADALDQMPLRDFNKIRNQARSFLLKSE